MDDAKFWLTAAGTLAALFTISSFAAQIIKIWREKDATAVSLKTYLFTVSAFTLWTIYGVGTNAWPLVVANSVSLALSATALYMKWKFRDHETARKAQAAE
jgi:MtN3 and saliva related transmembrane protein